MLTSCWRGNYLTKKDSSTIREVKKFTPIDKFLSVSKCLSVSLAKNLINTLKAFKINIPLINKAIVICFKYKPDAKYSPNFHSIIDSETSSLFSFPFQFHPNKITLNFSAQMQKLHTWCTESILGRLCPIHHLSPSLPPPPPLPPLSYCVSNESRPSSNYYEIKAIFHGRCLPR